MKRNRKNSDTHTHGWYEHETNLYFSVPMRVAFRIAKIRFFVCPIHLVLSTAEIKGWQEKNTNEKGKWVRTMARYAVTNKCLRFSDEKRLEIIAWVVHDYDLDRFQAPAQAAIERRNGAQMLSTALAAQNVCQYPKVCGGIGKLWSLIPFIEWAENLLSTIPTISHTCMAYGGRVTDFWTHFLFACVKLKSRRSQLVNVAVDGNADASQYPS